MLIAGVGDWTRDLIANPPKEIWSRGAEAHGVLRIATMFSPITLVATGSGIGPVLSFINAFAPEHKVKIVWSVRSPLKNFGPEHMELVYAADPFAFIIDTDVLPMSTDDLFKFVWAVAESTRSVALGVISHKKITDGVVNMMEERSIPAFGAIYDS